LTNLFFSPEWEDISSPPLSIKSPHAAPGKTLSANVGPVLSPSIEKMNKRETRNAVIDFVSRKTGKSFDR